MNDKIYNNKKCYDYNDVETEDGEIDDVSSAETKRKEDEVEKYNLRLNALGKDLRCNCCGDVYSDPVKLKCQHLIDRSCAFLKKIGNAIECSICHNHTHCENVDKLITDFNSASRIPPKPESVLEMINKHGGHLIKLNRERKTDSNDSNADGYRKSIKTRKRKRTSRWDTTDEAPKTSFSEAIMDILSSHDFPKNITMSQFKKFTEISSKSSLMSLLTKTVLQRVNDKVKKKNLKKSDEYSDSEILEMLSLEEFDGLFELEKTQFILLYRDAMDKGAILPQPHSKLSKPPLLPTPEPLPADTIKSETVFSPESPKKGPSPESSDSDFCDKTSVTNSNVSDKSHTYDVSDSKLRTDNKHKPAIVEYKTECTIAPIKENSSNIFSDTKQSAKSPKANIPEENLTSNGIICIDESVQYRERVNHLHSIYSNMYHASLKMKELENQKQSTDYQSANKTYSENYIEYQNLYSLLQGVTDSQSVVSEKSNDQNQCENAVPPINVLDERTESRVNCQEQASSTISPGGYAPDSTESLSDTSKHKPVNDQLRINTDVRSSLSPDILQNTKPTPTDNTDNFGYLWVSNLCKETRTSDLCQLFGKFGHVSKIKLFQYTAQTPMTFFSLIFMSNIKEAETAYKELHNVTLFERPLNIKMLDNDPLCDEGTV